MLCTCLQTCLLYLPTIPSYLPTFLGYLAVRGKRDPTKTAGGRRQGKREGEGDGEAGQIKGDKVTSTDVSFPSFPSISVWPPPPPLLLRGRSPNPETRRRQRDGLDLRWSNQPDPTTYVPMLLWLCLDNSSNDARTRPLFSSLLFSSRCPRTDTISHPFSSGMTNCNRNQTEEEHRRGQGSAASMSIKSIKPL